MYGPTSVSVRGRGPTGRTAPPGRQNGELKVARCLNIPSGVCWCVYVGEALCQSANSKLIDFRISFPHAAHQRGTPDNEFRAVWYEDSPM